LKARFYISCWLLCLQTLTARLFAGDLPTADKVLALYVSALGGEANIRRHETVQVIGQVEIQQAGIAAKCTIYRKAPAESRIVVQLDAGAYLDLFDGERAKKGMETNALKEKSLTELQIDKRTKHFFRSLSLGSLYAALKVDRVEEIEGREAYVVIATTAAGKTDELAFDSATHLLIKERIELDPAKRLGGIKYPFKTTTRINSLDSPIVFTVSEVRWSESISEELLKIP
jgi:hypothetical protein